MQRPIHLPCTPDGDKGGTGQSILLKGSIPGELGSAFILGWGMQCVYGQQNRAFNQLNPPLNLLPQLRNRPASVSMALLSVCLQLGGEIMSFQSLKAKL